MKALTILIFTVAGCLLFAGFVTAEERPVPAHSPEWTDQNASDPGMMSESVAKDLQGIVVLCATQPESEQFDQAWLQYVKKHQSPDFDVNATIEEVIERAENHLTFGDGVRGSRLPRAKMDKDRIRSRMRRIAAEALSSEPAELR